MVWVLQLLFILITEHTIAVEYTTALDGCHVFLNQI